MKFNTRFNPPVSAGVDMVRPSRTFQHFKDECDINIVVAKYANTGFDPYEDRKGGMQFVDFTELPRDYREAQQKILEADEAFQDLPSAIRSRFDNSPAKLLDFVNDSGNYDEAVKLGLVPAPPAVQDVVPSTEESATVSESSN